MGSLIDRNAKLRYLLDTNIVIGVLKDQPAAVELVHEREIQFDNAAISQIARMELLSFPRLTGEEEEQVRAFLGDCHVILCDEAVERSANELRRAHGLRLPDAIILATARLGDLELLTLDGRLQAVSR